MKILQWDKLPQQQVAKTHWKEEEPQKEQSMLKKLQADGVWLEMEEDFKAKQLVVDLISKFIVFSVVHICSAFSPKIVRSALSSKAYLTLRPRSALVC
jgi:hypothetical protein